MYISNEKQQQFYTIICVYITFCFLYVCNCVYIFCKHVQYKDTYVYIYNILVHIH